MIDRDQKLPKRLDFLVAEYSALKQEQTTRIAIRETALYINLGLLATIFGLTDPDFTSRAHIFDFLSMSSLVLFWIYFLNDSYVSRIRRYIIKTLDMDSLKAAIHDSDVKFLSTWEFDHHDSKLEKLSMKFFHLFIIAFSFFVPVIISIFWGTAAGTLIGSSLLAVKMFVLVFIIYGIFVMTDF